jgi:hypothetical protein
MIRIKIWDNGGMTIDRYTVAIQKSDYVWDIYGMSSDPSLFNQYSHTDCRGEMSHCGKRILFSDLPEKVQIAIRQRA